MSAVKRHTYNLRKRNCKRKHSIDDRKRSSNVSYIQALPNEILLHIFSYLNIHDLYYNVRLVCRRWHHLSMLSSSWKRISVGNNISRHVLNNWIRFSPVIRHIQISDRTDVNFILETASQHLGQLKSITINNNWDSQENFRIRSETLCNVMTRCQKIEEIVLGRIKIRLKK